MHGDSSRLTEATLPLTVGPVAWQAPIIARSSPHPLSCSILSNTLGTRRVLEQVEFFILDRLLLNLPLPHNPRRLQSGILYSVTHVRSRLGDEASLISRRQGELHTLSRSVRYISYFIRIDSRQIKFGPQLPSLLTLA